MNIAYFCDISSIHNLKWIEHFSHENNVIVITDKKHFEKKYCENIKIKSYYLLPETYPALRGFIAKKRIMNSIKKVLSENRIDIIHSLYAVPYSFWAHKLNFQKHIITTRGSDVLIEYNKDFKQYKNIKEQFSKRILNRLFENAMRKANFITSTSKTQQKVIKTFIHNSNKLILTRTGLDIDLFESKFNSLKKTTPNEQITILSPRLIKPIYNTHIAIDAFNKIINTFGKLNYKLLLIDYFSNPTYLASIKNQIQNLKLQTHIEILTGQTQSDMLQQYKNADAIIMIPQSDGTPMSAIEAMLAKKPVIIGNADYDSDIFNNSTVWRLNTFAPEELAKVTISVIENSTKDKNQKIKSAYEIAKLHSDIKTTLSKLAQLYAQVIST